MKRSFRHELKYYIHYHEYHILRNKLKAILERDHYSDKNGNYHVRSLYFDDAYNSCLFEKLSGVERRKKFRIRIYNLSDKTIKLECKRKVGSLIAKDVIHISRDEYESLLKGEYDFLKKSSGFLYHDFYRSLKHNLYRPIVIVDYIREAFVAPFNLSRIRINFDKELQTGVNKTDLFDKHLTTMNLVERPRVILEIKYESFLPEHLKQVLQVGAADRCAISKYTIGRSYNKFNSWEDN